MEYIVFNCPHCRDQVIVFKKEINCSIFRHAYYKKNMEQIPPHTSKDECDRLVSKGLVYGCAKPFQIDKKTYEVSICGYI